MWEAGLLTYYVCIVKLPMKLKIVLTWVLASSTSNLLYHSDLKEATPA